MLYDIHIVIPYEYLTIHISRVKHVTFLLHLAPTISSIKNKFEGKRKTHIRALKCLNRDRVRNSSTESEFSLKQRFCD